MINKYQRKTNMNKETTKIIKAQVLTKEVILEFSTQESLKILLNTFLEFSLYENKELSLKEYKEIKEKDSFFRVKDYAYYLLKFRDYVKRKWNFLYINIVKTQNM